MTLNQLDAQANRFIDQARRFALAGDRKHAIEFMRLASEVSSETLEVVFTEAREGRVHTSVTQGDA